ncbi:MAG: phosphoribosyl-ATP pyrophosphohydrolase [Ruminococcaceae bacterium]|nr:phosphoribosyl-ATP pyrophosphohydrolase [Oscillospiraceae bacterium]
MKKIYNKLVRDRIPEIIKAGGSTCTVRVLSDEEYLSMLDAKLTEELAEYHADGNPEELADLLEVIYAAAGARGVSPDTLDGIRQEKAIKRGAFEQKLLLVDVTEAD